MVTMLKIQNPDSTPDDLHIRLRRGHVTYSSFVTVKTIPQEEEEEKKNSKSHHDMELL